MMTTITQRFEAEEERVTQAPTRKSSGSVFNVPNPTCCSSPKMLCDRCKQQAGIETVFLPPSKSQPIINSQHKSFDESRGRLQMFQSGQAEN